MTGRACLLVTLLLAACDSDTTRPEPQPPPLELTARVNIQLGDTPAGEAPRYTITGEARATQGALEVTATIDSVVISYRIADGEWLLQRKTSSFPISDALPFTAQAGQQYSVRAILYAHASRSGTATVRAQDEWVAVGRGV